MLRHELSIESLGGACPVQGEGTLDGEAFYFRYRHDSAQLYVGENTGDDELVDYPRLYAELDDVTGIYDNGVLSRNEAIWLIHTLADELRPVAEWERGTEAQRMMDLVEYYINHMVPKVAEDSG